MHTDDDDHHQTYDDDHQTYEAPKQYYSIQHSHTFINDYIILPCTATTDHL